MDKTLDEIISTRPRSGRRGANRRSLGRSQILGTGGSASANSVRQAKANAAGTTKASPAPTPQKSDKIVVSNLPHDVDEAQVRDLFLTIGPLRSATLHHDSNGRFKGIAAIHFARFGDGTNAYLKYHNKLIDGKRPIKIEIIVDPTKQPLASRVAAAPVAEVAPAARLNNGANRPRRGRGRGGKTGSERSPKTAADLDAEMEDYTASNAPAAAPA